MAKPQFLGGIISKLVQAGNATEWVTVANTAKNTAGKQVDLWIPLTDLLTQQLTQMPVIEFQFDYVRDVAGGSATMLLRGYTAKNTMSDLVDMYQPTAAGRYPFHYWWVPNVATWLNPTTTPNLDSTGGLMFGPVALTNEVRQYIQIYTTSNSGAFSLENIKARVLYIPKG